MMQNELKLSRKDAARVKHLLRQPRPCLLCSAFPASLQGIFQPTKPELWGGKPGKVRLLGWPLRPVLCRRPAPNAHRAGG